MGLYRESQGVWNLMPDPTPKLTADPLEPYRETLMADLKRTPGAVRDKHPTPELTTEERTWNKLELLAHREKAKGNYWCWQGDGEDHLESLTCPVLVSAAQVRELLAARSKAFEEAAEAVKGLHLKNDSAA